MATPATIDDVSELKLLGAIRTLSVKPEHVETKEDFEKLLSKYGATHKSVTTITADKRTTPRISVFFGE